MPRAGRFGLFFFQAEDGIRDWSVTGVQTCALPIWLVFGVANKRSIAWGIAQALHDAGMRLAFTYQGERLEETVRELATSLDASYQIGRASCRKECRCSEQEEHEQDTG